MCRNLILSSRKGTTIPDFILESLLETVKTNHDGFALYAVLENGEEVYERTLSLYSYARALFHLQNKNVLFFHTHQRAATSGFINVDNVHLWNNHDLFFSHNGFVEKYAPLYYSYGYVKQTFEEESDSRKFFFNNIEQIKKYFKRGKIDKLRELCEEEGLYGVVMINDRKGNFIVLGVNKPAYLYFFDNFIVVSNTEINVNVKTVACSYIKSFNNKISFEKYRRKKKLKEYVDIGLDFDYWFKQ